MTETDAILYLMSRGWTMSRDKNMVPGHVRSPDRVNQCGACLDWVPARLVSFSSVQRAYLCQTCERSRVVSW